MVDRSCSNTWPVVVLLGVWCWINSDICRHVATNSRHGSFGKTLFLGAWSNDPDIHHHGLLLIC